MLVVCSATLRTNWQNEINKWLDETNVQTIFHAADNVSLPTPHFVVISYDLCLRLDEQLRDRFRIIICDEAQTSHTSYPEDKASFTINGHTSYFQASRAVPTVDCIREEYISGVSSVWCQIL